MTKIHPSLNLHLSRSTRSSSDSPNFQNIPNRDEEARKIVRSGIIPSPGNKLCEADFSGIEVRVAACYSKDPALLNYLRNNLDMHKDQAKAIFILEEDQVTKDIRYHAKNGWVFPQFYGSYYVECAKNLWVDVDDKKTADGIFVKDHLVNKEIKSLYDFEKHLKRMEEKFWTTFHAFAEWKDKQEEFFRKRGYVEMFSGHRRYGILSRNEIVNTPIQGTAFHCLLWSCIQINNIAKKEEWKTKLCGQIHDSMFLDLYPPEEDQVVKIIRKIMTVDILKAFPWIIVPMEVEISMTEINQSWYYANVRKENNNNE